jgi:hypothetical protein
VVVAAGRRHADVALRQDLHVAVGIILLMVVVAIGASLILGNASASCGSSPGAARGGAWILMDK